VIELLVVLAVIAILASLLLANWSNPRHVQRTIMVVIFAMLLSTVVLTCCSSREPSYEGKPLSAWLLEYDKFDEAYEPSAPPQPWPHDAVRHMGTNAIPWLLKSLRKKDSRLEMAMMKLAKQQSIFKKTIASGLDHVPG